MKDANLTRREVLAGGAATLAVLTTGAARAAEEKHEAKGETLNGFKQVPEYVSDRELESWTLDVLASLEEGLALIKVFELAGGKTRNPHLLKFSNDAPDLIGMKGLLLSDAMRAHRHIFDRNYVTTVRFGEIYGELDSALRKWLAAQAKRRAK